MDDGHAVNLSILFIQIVPSLDHLFSVFYAQFSLSTYICSRNSMDVSVMLLVLLTHFISLTPANVTKIHIYISCYCCLAKIVVMQTTLSDFIAFVTFIILIIEVAKAKNTISERRICITKFLFAASVYIVQTIWAIIMFYLLNNLLSIIETSPSTWHLSFYNGLDLSSTIMAWIYSAYNINLFLLLIPRASVHFISYSIVVFRVRLNLQF